MQRVGCSSQELSTDLSYRGWQVKKFAYLSSVLGYSIESYVNIIHLSHLCLPPSPPSSSNLLNASAPEYTIPSVSCLPYGSSICAQATGNAWPIVYENVGPGKSILVVAFGGTY